MQVRSVGQHALGSHDHMVDLTAVSMLAPLLGWRANVDEGLAAMQLQVAVEGLVCCDWIVIVVQIDEIFPVLPHEEL
eukprot:Skav220331  [mRNA]  locus=scaffold1726:1311:13612:+ [translate_table: standard]